MAIDKITTPAIADDAVTNAKVSYNNNQFRNIVINGDMSIAQRGTSFSSLGNGDSAYTLDRFKFSEEGDFGSAEITVSQDTTVPSGQGFAKSLKCVCATADTSVDSNTISYIEQRIEGQNLQYLKKGTSNAEALTLSFWCRSNLTGTFTVYVKDEDNSRMFSTSYSLSSADTWEKITINIPADTTGAFTNDNGSSLLINWNLQAGTNKSNGSLASTWQSISEGDRAVGQTNFFSSTSNNWYITGVQLEAGTSASDFEFLPLDVNLQRCQRYFYVFGDRRTSGAFPIVEQRSIGLGVTHYANQMVVSITMKVNMRTAPSIDQVTGTDFYDYYHGQASDGFDSFNGIASSGEAQMIIRNTNQISASVNNCGIVYINGTNAYTAFDAEL